MAFLPFRQSLEPNATQGSEGTEVTRGYKVIPVSVPICVPVYPVWTKNSSYYSRRPEPERLPCLSR